MYHLKYVQIIEFSKKRNPFNHPSVMFKKNIVKEVGLIQKNIIYSKIIIYGLEF